MKKYISLFIGLTIFSLIVIGLSYVYCQVIMILPNLFYLITIH